jgi:hypothetical protein
MRFAIPILVVASSIVLASAMTPRAQNATNPEVAPGTKMLVPGTETQKATPLLSKSECAQAGGTVIAIDAKICNGSTNACSTFDQKGKGHIVCISK